MQVFISQKDVYLRVFKNPSRQYTGQFLTISEECWQLIDIKRPPCEDVPHLRGVSTLILCVLLYLHCRICLKRNVYEIARIVLSWLYVNVIEIVDTFS